jgi:hypothetical protein
MTGRFATGAALFVAAVLAVVVAAQSSAAITAELAKKCRALAIKAHPYSMPGRKGPGTAQAQREYFNECVARNGNMPDGGAAGDSGSGRGATPNEPPK